MISAILQARMSSTRLPGKVLADIVGKPMLQHILTRLACAQSLNGIVVATTTDLADDAIATFCEHAGVICFRGSNADVLDRYYNAACRLSIRTIVRITADCPLLDPEIIDRTVELFRTEPYDYVSTTCLERTWPDGLDVEVFSIQALEKAWREADWQSEREHVTPFIWKHPERFRLGQLQCDRDLSDLRWTVDDPRDLEFVRTVYTLLPENPTYLMAEVLAILAANPELRTMNADIECNEGYRKSLMQDKMIALEEGRS